MKLENRVGKLVEIYPQLDPDTIQQSDEITNDRRTDEDLRKKWFWTADFAMYTIENNEVFLNLAARENNLIFQNIEKATKQLIKNDDYVPEKEDIETVIKSKTTLRTKLSDLNLENDSHEYSHIYIDTLNYIISNQEQRKIAERVYGQGDDFKNNMKMFKSAGIDRTRIFVLNPIYVKNHVKEGSAIARVCWLNSFDCNSDFCAVGRGVDYFWWLSA